MSTSCSFVGLELGSWDPYWMTYNCLQQGRIYPNKAILSNSDTPYEPMEILFNRTTTPNSIQGL